MRKTKIICTLGPASSTYEQIKKMAMAGMDVARINMSHSSHEEHLALINIVKKVREELHISLPIMIDTKGPEVRIGNFVNGKIEVVEGMKMDFVSEEVLGDETKVSVTYKDLYKDVKIGDQLLLNDGLLVFNITYVKDGVISAVAQNSGTLSNHKGLYVPNVKLNMPFLTDADKNDLDFAVEVKAELISASFVQDGQCMQDLRNYLDERGGQKIVLVAKIESQSGLNNIDEIIKHTDGIMVARGDLGVETPYEKLPAIQKMLITKSRMAGKFVITATEMLESMVTHLRPTRAEIIDVANAVYDGSSCVMLSAESAVGINPSNTISIMAKIAEAAENTTDYKEMYSNSPFVMLDTTDAISHATVNTSFDLNASAIAVYTSSGLSARMISRFRPKSPIIALTFSKDVFNQLATSWGVIPVMCQHFTNTDAMFENASKVAKELGLAKPGDKIIITAGLPIGTQVGTNVIKVQDIN